MPDLVADIKALHPDLDYLFGIAFHPSSRRTTRSSSPTRAAAGIDDGTKLSRFHA